MTLDQYTQVLQAVVDLQNVICISAIALCWILGFLTGVKLVSMLPV